VSTHFKYVHDFDCDIPAFWTVFFNEDYNVEMYRRIKVKERKMLERKEDDKTVSFAVKIMPERDLPGIIKKIVGGDLGYTERSTLDRATNRMDVSIEPTLMKDRTKIKGIYSVESIAPNKVRRTFEGDIAVDIPLVGKKVEATVLEDVKRSYDIAAEVTKEWLAK
jgi:hypothetical protein